MNNGKSEWKKILKHTRHVEHFHLPRPHDSRRKVRWYQRQYLVNKDLQLKYARSGALVGFISTVVSAGMLLSAFYSFNIWQGQRLPAPVLAVIGAVFLLNIFGIYVATVVTTQKIAGPLFNLVRQFNRLKNHDFSVRARFRSDDEFQNVAIQFNQMVDALDEREKSLYEGLIAIQNHLSADNMKAALEDVEFLKGIVTPYKQNESKAA
jgi:nitrate/nitrite-specific signal transduction histidine kinase